MNELTKAEFDEYNKLMEIMLNPSVSEEDATYLASHAKAGAEIAKKTAEGHLGELRGASIDVEGVLAHLSVGARLSLIAGAFDFIQHVQIQDFEKQFGEAS